ncbi:MAG: sigma-70 family RNA polymerase sigma factor [Pseudomonadota bacterium]
MPDGTLSDIPTSVVKGDTDVRLTEAERFELGLLKYRRNLKAYACSLARDVEAADDLVQETLLRALANRDKFDSGTNLRAWLFTILKNLFRTRMRNGQRDVELTDAMAAGPLFAVRPAQDDSLRLRQLVQAIRALPRAQSNAVIMVGALGYSIEEVSQRENCPAGTIKSRVSRARSALAHHLS